MKYRELLAQDGSIATVTKMNQSTFLMLPAPFQGFILTLLNLASESHFKFVLNGILGPDKRVEGSTFAVKG